LNKLYDYLYSSRPVVFAGTSPNDPVNESGCGFTVKPESPEEIAKAIIKLIEMSKKDRINMGQMGKLYIKKNHSMKVLGREMESLLIEAINSKANEKKIRR